MATSKRLYDKPGRPPGTNLVTRDALLRAGLEVFATHGYDAASTRQIVDEAGVAPPALYHHFGSKVGLYEAVATHVHDTVLARFEEVVAEHDDLVSKVVAILEVSADVQASDPALVRFIVTAPVEMSRHEELAPVSQQMVRLLKFVDALCEASVPPGEDPRPRARAVQTLIYGIGRMGATLSAQDFREVIDANIALVRGQLFTGSVSASL